MNQKKRTGARGGRRAREGEGGGEGGPQPSAEDESSLCSMVHRWLPLTHFLSANVCMCYGMDNKMKCGN